MSKLSNLTRTIFKAVSEHSGESDSLARVSFRGGTRGALATFLITPSLESHRALAQRNAEHQHNKIETIRRIARTEYARLEQTAGPLEDSACQTSTDLIEHARELLEHHNPEFDDILDRLSCLVRQNSDARILEHIGHFLARSMFKPNLTTCDLRAYLDLFEPLRWRQLCLIAGLYRAEKQSGRTKRSRRRPPETDRQVYEAYGHRDPRFESHLEQRTSLTFAWDVDRLVDQRIIISDVGDVTEGRSTELSSLSPLARSLYELFALDSIDVEDWGPTLIEYLYRGKPPGRKGAVDLDYLRARHT